MTVVNFQPSAVSPFQFQAAFDGQVYTVSCPYNLFGQRYYIQVADLSGNIILLRPMVGSPPKTSASMAWAAGLATASLSSPHNIPLAAVAKITIAGTGTAYDGVVQAYATGPYTLAWPMAVNPQSSPDGYYSQDVNLLDGYFQSTLVFRPGSQQFEF